MRAILKMTLFRHVTKVRIKHIGTKKSNYGGEGVGFKKIGVGGGVFIGLELGPWAPIH